MNNKSKTRTLVWIIIFLLLSNIAMLIFFVFLNADRRHGKGEDRNVIAKGLETEAGFSKQQMEQYRNLKKEHLQKARMLLSGVVNAKDSFYKLLYMQAPDSVISKGAAAIGEKQIALDVHTFSFFKSIRNISTASQLPKVDSVLNKFIQRVIIRKGRRPEDKKR